MKARISASAVAVTVILLGFSHLADAALFMKVDNIMGDSKDNLHMGWSDVSSLQLFFNSDCTGTSGGEACSPTSMFARFAMTVDGAYTQMLQRQLSQALNTLVTIEAFTGNRRIDRYEFMDVPFGDLSVSYLGGAPGQLIGNLSGPQHVKAIHYLYDPNSGAPLGQTMTMWDFGVVQAQASTQLSGDYDRDGDVDSDDYQVWRSEFGGIMATVGAGADGNADGQVDAADYPIWRHNLAFPLVMTSNVPEPNTATLLVFIRLVASRSRFHAA